MAQAGKPDLLTPTQVAEIKEKTRLSKGGSRMNTVKKARYIALTDVNESRWNRRTEVDDIQSLIRLLLYSNDIDLEGIIPCSSCFLKRPDQKKQVRIVRRVIDAYEKVKPNLDVHGEGYPSADALRGILHPGIAEYGAASGRGFAHRRYEDTPGIRCILRAMERPDPRPLWIGLWGGANTLAQAVWQLAQAKSGPELARLLGKLRVYSISDQDMAGQWLRREFGDRLMYLVTPSEGTVRGSRDYFRAVWPGISGDRFAHGSEDGSAPGGFTGARWDMIDTPWLERNIISVGPYGAQYPRPIYLTEGDTPAFLGLISNGLNVPEHPEYGGWGGRYAFSRPDTEPYPIWTNSRDCVTGADGRVHCSPQATLWRWRADFQDDFAARMQWTVHSRYSDCIHTPIAAMDVPGTLTVRPGEAVTPDASGSRSPDGLPLSFLWYVYPEAGSYAGPMEIENARTARPVIHIPDDLPKGAQLHVILEVSHQNELQMKAYRRLILKVGAG